MKKEELLSRVRDVVRRKHYSYKTEQTYTHWIGRFYDWLKARGGLCEASPAAKMEAYLSDLAQRDCAAATQNQAFNALLFCFRGVLGQEVGEVHALRAKRPARLRYAPTVAEVRALLGALPERSQGQPVKLIVQLLYGCGLRVSEPLELRVKDVDLTHSRLVIRGAKGDKDRVVPLPCAVMPALHAQLAVAAAVARADAVKGLPVQIPHLLAKKYPALVRSPKWAFVFPSERPCRHPRSGELVRWRCAEQIIQRAVRDAARSVDMSGVVTPHCLRHAYATHALEAGANVRAVQAEMGHSSLETTMGYLHAEAESVRSPLDVVQV